MGTIKSMRKYENGIEFQETHKLWIDANHLPVVKGSDNAIWNRLYLFPFNVEIPQDKIIADLPKHLESEAEGILAWLVAGAKRFYAHGLRKPKAVIAAVQDWREEMDIVKPFIDECCDVHAITKGGAYVSKAEIWDAYVRWADTRPDHKRLDKGGFFEYVLNLGFKEAKVEGGTVRAIRGITFKTRRAAS
jgi:putative DNA primase/helicase